jgi:hypothetical protein
LADRADLVLVPDTGLQTHGGTDRISYREIQVKDIAPADIPVNTVAPSVSGTGVTGQPLTCNRGTWSTAAGTTYFVKWYRSNKIASTNPRFRAPSATDYWNQTTPANPLYGTQNLTWTDSLLVGENETYTPVADDIGKVIHCAVSADNAGATVWKTALAPEIGNSSAGGTVPATLSLTLGAPATFGAFTPGITKTYDASTSANVISTAADATLSVSASEAVVRPLAETVGHLMNGTFSLPEPLQVSFSKSTWTGPVSNDPVTIAFKQLVKDTDALRTGAYSKTLTFTLSTTTP